MPPYAQPIVLRTLAEAEAAAGLTVRRLDPALAAVHPMGGLRIGADPRTSACDGDGRYRSARGLWVADGSLFCGSIGGPPQLSIYALGLHVGRSIGVEG